MLLICLLLILLLLLLLLFHHHHLLPLLDCMILVQSNIDWLFVYVVAPQSI
jgi:hypothetical protein